MTKIRTHKKKGFRSRKIHRCELNASCNSCKPEEQYQCSSYQYFQNLTEKLGTPGTLPAKV